MAAAPWRGMSDLCSRTVRDCIGIDVVYTPISTGIPVPIRAPYDDPHRELVLSNGHPDSLEVPVLDVRLEDLPAFPELGDLVEIQRLGQSGTDVFEVTDVRLGGQGTAKLALTLDEAP